MHSKLNCWRCDMPKSEERFRDEDDVCISIHQQNGTQRTHHVKNNFRKVEICAVHEENEQVRVGDVYDLSAGEHTKR